MRKYISIVIGCLIFLLPGSPLFSQAPPKPRDTTIVGPQTFAMIMGISSYKYVRPLTYADKDAEMFRDFLKSPGGGKLSDDNIYCLLNEQALLANFYQKGFQWLKAKNLQKGDRLFIYLAGHGDAIDEDQFFYLAYDCNPAGDKNNYLVSGAIRMYDVKVKIQKEAAKGVEVYLIMDACRSNELPGGAEGQSFFNTAISEKRAGEIIMLATGAGQESLEDASIGSGHGLFTYFLVDGLTGMADSADHDNKITLTEIQQYVDKNVPQIAQDRFRRKQDPFFCCNENSDKIVSLVDTAYLRKWIDLKKLQASGGKPSAYAPRGRGLDFSTADTALIEAYNLFNQAVKESKLTGNQSAEYYCNLMLEKYPGTSYTVDAQSTLAVEFINFAQSKINLYLDCKDASSIQKIRAQIDEDDKTDEINTSFNRMEKVAQQEFYSVGEMLEKAIDIILPDDPDFAKSLQGKMYFFKARGYFGKNRKMVDIATAFNYAYIAYGEDKNAAYILNTLASLHLDNNKYDSAIFYAKKAIITAPRWRYPYVTLAFAYKTLNQRDSAIKYYRRSIEVDPANADAYVDLGHYYYALSMGDSAVAFYQKALQIDPENPYASNNIGWVNYSRKNFPDAIRYFKRSIAANPTFINAYNGLSKTFFDNQEFDSARIYYAKAFSNYQDKSIVNVYIGNFFKELKQYDSAKVYYRMAAGLDPNYEEAFNNLGTTSFSLKEYDSARYYYHRALQANPYSAYALINLGLVFRELKNADSTYSYFQQAVKMEPGNPSILNSVGVIYGQEKIYDSAKSYFRKALNVQPDYKPASKNMIKIFREMSQLDSVTYFLKGTSFLDPNSSSFLNDLGLAFFEQKRYDSARVYFRNAIRKDPLNPQFYNNMGLVLEGLKLLDSSSVYLKKASGLDQNNQVYLSNLINIFRKGHQIDSASFYLRKQMVQTVEPGIETWYALAEFFSEAKVYDSSEFYYRKVIQANPGYKSAYSHAGSDFLQNENYDSAIVFLSKAVQLNPKSKSATLDLGLTYHAMGQWDSAIVYLEKAIQLDPKSRSYYELACSYAQHRQPDKAVQNLQLAFQKGYKSFNSLLTDPDLEVLKNNKDFQVLLDKYIPDWRNR